MTLKTKRTKTAKNLKKCPSCHGAGKIKTGNSLNKQDVVCNECHGTGFINKFK